jgi:dolichol-phosphate mannosyltransferase
LIRTYFERGEPSALETSQSNGRNGSTPQLTILLPTRNEKANLELLFPLLDAVLKEIGVPSETIVVDGDSTDGTLEMAKRHCALAFQQDGAGYGLALKQGFKAASGTYIVTLDADLSHEPKFIQRLWENRERADVVVASRYCEGGAAKAPLFRRFLSNVLNWVFTTGFGVPVSDVSSGFRLYKADVVKALEFEGTTYDALEEILIRIHNEGGRIIEVPFTYAPRVHGTSNARIFRIGMRLLSTFFRLRRLRRSNQSPSERTS